MKLRNITSIVLAIISIGSAILASSIKDTVDAPRQELPFYVIALITGIIALVLHYWSSIRRATYPAIICMWAWLYDHKLAKSQFSSHTYRVYVYFGRSYKNLYAKVQSAFDEYSKAEANV